MKNKKTQLREVIRLNIILNRKKLGITQKALGNRLGLNENTVASWEQGLSTPNIDTIAELLDIFNMDFYDFTGLKSPK